MLYLPGLHELVPVPTVGEDPCLVFWMSVRVSSMDFSCTVPCTELLRSTLHLAPQPHGAADVGFILKFIGSPSKRKVE